MYKHTEIGSFHYAKSPEREREMGGGGGGGGGNYILTILAEKVPLLYTFYGKKVPLSRTYFGKSCSHGCSCSA